MKDAVHKSCARLVIFIAASRRPVPTAGRGVSAGYSEREYFPSNLLTRPKALPHPLYPLAATVPLPHCPPQVHARIPPALRPERASPLLHGSRKPSTALYVRVVSTACAANCDNAALCIIRVDSPSCCAVSTSIAIDTDSTLSPNSHHSYLARDAHNLTVPTPQPAICLASPPAIQPASHPSAHRRRHKAVADRRIAQTRRRASAQPLPQTLSPHNSASFAVSTARKGRRAQSDRAMATCIGKPADQKILAVAHERRRRFASSLVSSALVWSWLRRRLDLTD
jgi:hypothetical protein